MSAEAAHILILDQEKESSFYSYHHEPEPAPNREPVLFWDEIVKRWPKERFPSFISVNQSA